MLILDMFDPQVLALIYPDTQPRFHDSVKMYNCRPAYVLHPHTRVIIKQSRRHPQARALVLYFPQTICFSISIFFGIRFEGSALQRN
ncbi:hypothetical protein AAHA92_24148 [Salvia divinorum]|uniref:Uncharacterized protein n=1 Tax=Salvia divinorum TaxID=28513 RepID=A0ABD1G9L3_SALDI